MDTGKNFKINSRESEPKKIPVRQKKNSDNWKGQLFAKVFLTVILALGGYLYANFDINFFRERGEAVDQLNGVKVYYNGWASNVSGRHLSKNGYNYGLKWQCVEYVKRYYYTELFHSMPDTYGHAKDFFDANLADGQLNTLKNLTQYSNPSISKPEVNDILVLGASYFNEFGHVAIISNVDDYEIEIIQQNPGFMMKTRETFSLRKRKGKWFINEERVLGWLRKKKTI